MFEKFIIRILKSGAAAIYVLIMITLFSAPVLFIWQAFTPPEFTFENIEIIENIDEESCPKEIFTQKVSNIMDILLQN